VFSDGVRVGDAIHTSHRPLSSTATTTTSAARCKWNEWLTLPIKYSYVHVNYTFVLPHLSELSRDAQIVINVCDWHHNSNGPFAHVIAGTTISLFSKRAMLRNGMKVECVDLFTSYYRNVRSAHVSVHTWRWFSADNDTW
jgi:hypothetical protein